MDPMTTLSLPVVMFLPARAPIATLEQPVEQRRALQPTAVLYRDAMFAARAYSPRATFLPPVVLSNMAH